MLVIFFISHVASAGTNMYLIKKTNIDLLDIQTGFSFLLITRAFAAALLFILAEEIAGFFQDERLIAILKIMAFIPIIESFRNMALITEERKLSYRKIFIIGFHRKLCSFTIAIALAINDFAYMALIYAELVAAIYWVVIGHLLLPTNFEHYKLSFVRFKDQMGFNFWSFLQILFGFAKGKIDNILVARSLGISDLGVYELATTISSIPTEQLATPVSAPLYSALSKFKSKSNEQLDFMYASLTTLSMAVYFLAGLLASISFEVVLILLGEKWLMVAPLIVFLAFSYSIGAANVFLTRLLIVQNRVKELFINDIITLFIVVTLLLSALVNGGLNEIVQMRVLVYICALGVIMVFTSRYCALDIVTTLKSILPSALITLCAYALVKMTFSETSFGLIVDLALKSISYVFYTVILLIGWSSLFRFKNKEFVHITESSKIAIAKIRAD